MFCACPFFPVDKQAKFEKAIRKGDFQRVLELFPDIDPSANDQFALMEACTRGYIRIVEKLLQDPRVDPTVAEVAAIRLASLNGHREVVECLLKDPRIVQAFSPEDQAVLLNLKDKPLRNLYQHLEEGRGGLRILMVQKPRQEMEAGEAGMRYV